MAIQLGSAYGKVIIDSSGVSVGVGNAVTKLGTLEQTAKRVGASLQNIGRMMTIGLTLPILAIGGASIKAASDLEESRNKVAVVFGDMSDAVLKWSENSATAFGQSRQQALEAAGTFGNLFTSMGLTVDKSAEMSQSLVELASDLASFNNIDPQLALEKLRSGLVGEVEPLRTLGVNLNMVMVQAKAMEMGLADANGELSAAALVQARYALILEQTSNAQGDFARTSEGLANKTRIMKAELADAAAQLGVHLLPIALMVVKALVKLLEIFTALPEPVQKAILILAGLVALLGPMLMVIGTIVSAVGSIIGFLAPFGGLAAVAATLAPLLGAIAGGLFSIGLAILPIIGPLLLVIGTLALLYLAFKNNFMGITTTVKQLWEIIKFYFNLIVKRIVDSFKNINWPAIGKFILNGLGNGMLMGIPSITNIARRIALAVLDTIKKTLGIASDSKQAIKLGKFTTSGFLNGMAQEMDPNRIAKIYAKPVQNINTQQSGGNVFHLSNGVTIRDAERMMDEKMNRFVRTFERSMGAA